MKSTKTGDPQTLPLVGPLADTLDAQRSWLAETKHEGRTSGLIFPALPQDARGGATRRGRDELSWFRSASYLARPLEFVCEEAEVPVLSPHALRRAFEELLRRANVDQLVRRSTGGWRSPDAQDIYSDVDSEDRREALGSVLTLVEGRKKEG